MTPYAVTRTCQNRSAPGAAQYQVRTYTPRSSAVLPVAWAEKWAVEYRQAGYQVTIASLQNARGEVRLTVYGLPRNHLGCRLNDPLGEPGQRDPRDLQGTIKKHRPKVRPLTAADRLDAAVREEEGRRLRPDEEDEAAPSASPLIEAGEAT